MAARINIGMVGAGAVARAVHLPILTRRADLFDVVAICDPDSYSTGLVAERHGVDRTHTDLVGMLDGGGIDAVMATHSGSHTPTVLAALDAGLGVFSEKPLAYTRDEVDTIAAAASGRPVMVGYMKAYDPAVVAAEDYLSDLPEIRSVEVVVLHPSAEAQLASSELEPPQPRPESHPSASVPGDDELLTTALGPAAAPLGAIYSGVLLGSVSHDLSVMRALGMGVDRIDRARRWENPGGHRSVAFTGRSDNGADVSVRWHYLPNYPVYREEVRFHTDAGSVELVFPAPYLLRAPTELRVTVAAPDGARITLERSPEEAFERELVAFHDMLDGGASPRDGIDSGRADVITCQKIAAALAESEGVEIGGEASGIPLRE